MVNKIFNEDCFETMMRMTQSKIKVDCILTSPPYCTPNDSASKYTPEKFNNHIVFYDVFEGFETNEDYRKWSVDLFTAYDLVLAENGVVLYNLSYSVANPDLIYLVLADIINQTPFTIVDCISWKKNSALPQNRNPNRLTRVCEFVFVLCRKTELLTFKTTKKQYGRLQNNYTNLSSNFIEAPNNDIANTDNKLNNATFSTGLVTQLLSRYVEPEKEVVVYDSFMGTGTTAIGCVQYGCSYIGSELSEAQCKFAEDRLAGAHMIRNPGVKSLF